MVASLRDSLRAARIWGATERLRAEIGKPLTPSERPRYDRWVAAARIASGDDAAFDWCTKVYEPPRRCKGRPPAERCAEAAEVDFVTRARVVAVAAVFAYGKCMRCPQKG